MPIIDILLFILIALLCCGGLIMSCFSLSGTWLVLLGAVIASWVQWPAFPHIATIVVFTLICIGIEVLEAVAGAWGIQRRGGSKAAGWAALGGGFIGLILGGFIPILLIGPLIGMILGSFIAAFWVEYKRVEKVSHAAHIATGSVLARLSILLLKVIVTFILSLILWTGLFLSI